MMGANVDPRLIQVDDNPNPTPLVIGGQISTNIPDTTAKMALPNSPWRKRHTRIVWTFEATASGICQRPRPKRPVHRGMVRPQTSLMGPKIRGPAANPRMCNVIPRFITSCETPYCCAVILVAGPKILADMEVAMTKQLAVMEKHTLRHIGQFIGLAGSSSLSQSTMLGSVSKPSWSWHGSPSSSVRPCLQRGHVGCGGFRDVVRLRVMPLSSDPEDSISCSKDSLLKWGDSASSSRCCCS